jgi:hypothetical protein
LRDLKPRILGADLRKSSSDHVLSGR